MKDSTLFKELDLRAFGLFTEMASFDIRELTLSDRFCDSSDELVALDFVLLDDESMLRLLSVGWVVPDCLPERDSLLDERRSGFARRLGTEVLLSLGTTTFFVSGAFSSCAFFRSGDEKLLRRRSIGSNRRSPTPPVLHCSAGFATNVAASFIVSVMAGLPVA